MADPFVEALKGGVNTASELISLADDLDGVAKQVQDLGKRELEARRAWRHKQAEVKGDYAFLSAVDEYRRVREAVELKQQIKQEAIKRWGQDAWVKIEEIEARQKEDHKRMFTEDGHDREAMTALKWKCFWAAFAVTIILWVTGFIHELAILFYGE